MANDQWELASNDQNVTGGKGGVGKIEDPAT
jgi:hypothetical protein